jgi:uncharacterized membrane protein (UPF0127 family)
MILLNQSRESILATAIDRCDSFRTRLFGLMFRKNLPLGAALLLEPCNAIHTHFMRFPIDVLFCDAGGHVLHIRHAMRPWRHSPTIRGARWVVELPAGTATNTVVGDLLTFVGN